MDSSCYIKMYRRLVISSSCRHGHTVGTHVAFGRSLYSVRDFAYRLLRDTSHNTTALDIFENIIFFLSVYYCIEHVRGFGNYALYKSTFYLLTCPKNVKTNSNGQVSSGEIWGRMIENKSQHRFKNGILWSR